MNNWFTKKEEIKSSPEKKLNCYSLGCPFTFESEEVLKNHELEHEQDFEKNSDCD